MLRCEPGEMQSLQGILSPLGTNCPIFLTVCLVNSNYINGLDIGMSFAVLF